MEFLQVLIPRLKNGVSVLRCGLGSLGVFAHFWVRLPEVWKCLVSQGKT